MRAVSSWWLVLLCACGGARPAPDRSAPTTSLPAVQTTPPSSERAEPEDPVADVPLCIETLVVSWDGASRRGPREATRQAARSRAEALRARIAAGETVAVVRGDAEPQSHFPSCTGRWPAAVAAVAPALEPGRVHDDVVDTGDEFVVVRRLASDEVLQARHILVRVGPELHTRDEALALAQVIRRRALEPGADFAALARETSEEPGAAGRSGDLGPFTRGMMVEPFERAVLALRPGEISEVIETRFGFHVIQRLR